MIPRHWGLEGAMLANTAEQAMRGEFHLRTRVVSGPDLAEDEGVEVVEVIPGLVPVWIVPEDLDAAIEILDRECVQFNPGR